MKPKNVRPKAMTSFVYERRSPDDIEAHATTVGDQVSNKDARRVLRASHRSIACPTCGVGPGERCVRNKYNMPTTNHSTRVWAASKDERGVFGDLSVRAYNALMYMDIKSVEQLVDTDAMEFARLPNIGRVTLLELWRFLRQHGLEFKTFNKYLSQRTDQGLSSIINSMNKWIKRRTNAGTRPSADEIIAFLKRGWPRLNDYELSLIYEQSH